MRVNRRIALAIAIGLVLVLVVATVTVLLLRRGPASQAWDSCDDLGMMECPRQAARAVVPVAGSIMHLTYASDRVPGRKESAAPPAVPVGLAGWTLDVLDTLDVSTKTLVTGAGVLRRVNPVAVSIGTGRHAVASVDGRRVHVFDDSGRPVSVYDGMTGATVLTFAWDQHGLASVTDHAGRKVTVRRDDTGTPVRLDSSLGPLTRLGVRDGYLAAVQYPDGGRAKFTHNAEGLLTSWSDPAGITVRYGYDDAGRVVTRTDGTGAATKYERKTNGATMTLTTTGPTGTVTRDTVEAVSGGVVHTSIDGSGVATRLESRGTRRLLELPAGRKVTIELAPDPRWGMDAPVTASVSADGSANNTATLREQRSGGDRARPDAGHATQTVVTIEGEEWTSTYEPARRVSTTTGPGGHKSEVTFDSMGRVSAQSVAGQAPVAYEYNSEGRIAAVTLGSGAEQRTWKYTYDGARLTVTDPLGGVQVRTHAPNGKLASVSGPGTHELTLSTDAAGSLTGYAGPDGNAYQLVRRADGQPGAVTAPVGDSGIGFTNYEYDAAGRITGIVWPDGKQTFTRDAAGRVTAIDAGAGAWQLAYGDNGLLASASGPGATTAFTYAAGELVGQRTQGPFDVTVQRTLDALGRSATETVGSTPAISYSYDHIGLVTKVGDLTAERDLATGTLLREKIGSLTRTWSYNGFREPVGQTITRDGGSVVAEIRWERDNLGRVVSEATTAGGGTTTTQYTYDPAGRLATATRAGQVTTYNYDPAGNLTAVVAPDGAVTKSTYDGRNALVERAGVRYTYDGAGRLTSAGTTTYQYDRAGALLSVQPAQGPKVEYVNDVLGRRIARKVGGAVTGGFVYLDQLRPAAEVDASGAVTTRYVYGEGTTPVYLSRGGASYLQVADATGSPVLAVNANDGSIANAVTRDPWGQVISQTGTGHQAVGFAGGITDPDTGLVRFGARDYSPATGGWTAPDPLGVYGSGSANLYTYVSGDPVNHTDPTGMLCDYAAIGIHVGTALGPGASVGIGFAWTDTQGGMYINGGIASGAELIAAGQFTCMERVGKSSKPPALDDFGGTGASFEGAGFATGGVDVGFGQGGFGPVTAVGGHLGLGAGAGASVGASNTEHWCWFGCPDSADYPSADCVWDGTTCIPLPSDPKANQPDDMRNLCHDGSCEKDPNQDKAKPRAGTGRDPHLVTADGTYYDMHAVGEFVVIVSDSGDLQIQARQALVPGSRSLAVNSAFAIAVGSTRVQVGAIGTGTLDIVVDGQRLSGTANRSIDSSAALQLGQQRLTIKLADGTTIEITRNPLGLDLGLGLADSRKGHVRGLLGPYTGQFTNKVEARDGTSFDVIALTAYETLYGKFANSWRITQAESIFAYGPGQSTATFTDMAFPDRNPAPLPETARQTAEQVCRHLGLPEPALAGCITDVAATGDANFATATAFAMASRPGTAAPISSGTRVSDGATIEGRIESGGAAVRYDLDLGGAESFYVADWAGPGTGCDQTFSVNLVDVSTGNFPCEAGAVHFRVPDPNKTYQLEIAPAKPSAGTYKFTLITVKIRDLDARLGGSYQGRIDVRGRVDRHTFTAAGATAIRLAGMPATCDAGLVVEVFDDRQNVVMGYRGLCGTIDRIPLPDPNGRYAVHVRSDTLATGDYAFSVAAAS